MMLIVNGCSVMSFVFLCVVIFILIYIKKNKIMIKVSYLKKSNV